MCDNLFSFLCSKKLWLIIFNTGASYVAPVAKSLPAKCSWQEKQVWPWVGKISWRRAWQPTPVFLPYLNFSISNQCNQFFTWVFCHAICRFQDLKNWKKKTQFKVFFKITFYWDVADLQCFVSFRYTTKWFSYTDTYIHKYMSVPLSQFIPPSLTPW